MKLPFPILRIHQIYVSAPSHHAPYIKICSANSDKLYCNTLPPFLHDFDLILPEDTCSASFFFFKVVLQILLYLLFLIVNILSGISLVFLTYPLIFFVFSFAFSLFYLFFHHILTFAWMFCILIYKLHVEQHHAFI